MMLSMYPDGIFSRSNALWNYVFSKPDLPIESVSVILEISSNLSTAKASGNAHSSVVDAFIDGTTNSPWIVESLTQMAMSPSDYESVHAGGVRCILEYKYLCIGRSTLAKRFIKIVTTEAPANFVRLLPAVRKIFFEFSSHLPQSAVRDLPLTASVSPDRAQHDSVCDKTDQSSLRFAFELLKLFSHGAAGRAGDVTALEWNRLPILPLLEELKTDVDDYSI